MKLISTIYITERLEFTLHVSPKQPKGTSIEKLLKTHISKIGTESLIFNPKVYLIIRERGGDRMAETLIPVTLFYRFSSLLSIVYESLSTKDLYHRDGNKLYMDNSRASKVGRSMSTYRDTLTIVPTVFIDRMTNDMLPGIELGNNQHPIGSLAAVEALGLIDTIDHMDINTYMLLSGVIEKLDDMDDKMDRILDKLGVSMKQPIAPQRQRQSSLGWIDREGGGYGP